MTDAINIMEYVRDLKNKAFAKVPLCTVILINTACILQYININQISFLAKLNYYGVHNVQLKYLTSYIINIKRIVLVS